MIRISNIKIYEDISDDKVINIALNKYKIKQEDIILCNISKKSVDARKKDDVHYSYSIDLKLKNENKLLRNKNISIIKEFEFPNFDIKKDKKINPVIVGAGPAGLFAGLTFVQNGFKPIIIEQGQSVEERKKSVDLFTSTGNLNTFSNVQFGEGGAGTFSDGKLTSGINSPYCRKVLQEFVNFGAPEQILYLTKPHIGTDNLIKIIKNMREFIISKRGKFLFNTKFVDFETINNKISKVHVLNLEANSLEKIETDTVILAIGHSSRDTFEKIYEKGLLVEPKNFSVGVRIEHLQSEINKSQYGTITKLNLPSADYKLAYHSPSGRSCYTFCMCPGGMGVAAASEPGQVVTNGMSEFARDRENANAALLVGVEPRDFGSAHPLAGMYFQRRLEEAAFRAGGGDYRAPAQLVGDFLKKQVSTAVGNVNPSYRPGVRFTDLSAVLPDFVTETMRRAIVEMDGKLHGFAAADAVLTGVETRSSSPIRIMRDEHFEANIKGLYPCGEGAGYAGGIVSSAVDGLKTCLAVI